jgi:predicted MFS family arabinose efflux permease
VLALGEFSWSLSYIIGIPLAGLVIASNGWKAPFFILFALGGLMLLATPWLVPGRSLPAAPSAGMQTNFRVVFTSAPALLALLVSLISSGANEMINVVFGVWIEDSFQVKIATLGIASAIIGVSELGGEALVSSLTDRIGKPLAVCAGLVLNSLFALSLHFLEGSLAGILAGLFFFYISFEFTLVSMIPLVSEILPEARATLMASNQASRSLGRALGALAALPVYLLGKSQLLGILPSGIAVGLLNGLALLALLLLQKQNRSQMDKV